MQALRLHEVIQRVVRWHNRHPLARRISASQVHSIGEVVLPFAADRPWSAPGVVPRALTDAPPPPPEAPTPPPVLQVAVAAPAESEPTDVVDLDALADDLLNPETARPAAADGPSLADDAGQAPEVPAALSAEAAPDTADMPAPAMADDPAAADIDLPTDDATPPADGADAADAAAVSDAADLPAPPAAGAPAEGTTEDAAELAEQAAAARVPDLADDVAASQALLAAHEAALSAPPDLPPAPPSPPPEGPAAAAADANLDPAAAQAQAQAPAAQPSLAEVVERRAAARTAAAAAAPRGLRQWWARLCQVLRGRPADMPRLKAAFNRKVFWPSSPATVARWAQRHGQSQTLAPEDWPRRTVEVDPAQRTQLRRQGQVHGIELHALTAAIGVGDRRIRLLVGADGSILGPRAYSPPRLAGVSAVLLVGLLGLGWGLRPLGNAAPTDSAALAALAASAASAPAAVVQAAASAAPAASDAASATHLAQAPPAEPTDPAAAASATQGAAAMPASAAPALARAELPTEAAPAASAPVGRIRPSLSDEEKLAARAEGERLRGGPAAAPPPEPGPVYAIVSPSNRERKVAMNHLTIMRRAGSRLPPPAPDHSELMQNQGEWRAAWWPFASLADAERARVMLAGRGLHAEVVEF